MHSYYIIFLSLVIGIHSHAYSFKGETSNSKSGSASSSESGSLAVQNVPGYSASGSFSKSQSSSFAASSASSFNFQGNGPMPLLGLGHAPDGNVQGDLTYLGSTQDVGLPDISGAVSGGYAGVQTINTNGGYGGLQSSDKRNVCNVCGETGSNHKIYPSTNEGYPGHKTPSSNTYRPPIIHKQPTVYPGNDSPDESDNYGQPAYGQTLGGKINGAVVSHTGVYEKDFNGSPGILSPHDIAVPASQGNSPFSQNVNKPQQHGHGSVTPEQPPYSSKQHEQKWQKDKNTETSTNIRGPESFNGPPGILSPYDIVVPADKHTQKNPSGPSNIGNFELSGDELSANLDSEENYYENGSQKPSKGGQNKPGIPNLSYPQNVNVPNVVGSAPVPHHQHAEQQNARVPGGFNGPPGVLSPYDIIVPADKYKQHEPSNGHYEVSGDISTRIDSEENFYENGYVNPPLPIKVDHTSTHPKKPYTGGFDGPPGILTPNDVIVPAGMDHKLNKPISQGPHQTLDYQPPSSSVYPATHTLNNKHRNPGAGPQYTGGFGGPPGILKPIESETSPENPIPTYTPEYEKPNHESKHPPRTNTPEQKKPNHVTSSIETNYGKPPPEKPTYSHTLGNGHKTPLTPGPQYTGSFDGPPGVLKPVELDTTPKHPSASYNPEHEQPYYQGNTRPIESTYGNIPPGIPTYSHTPGNNHKTQLAIGPQYPDEFGGPPGILKPNESETAPENPIATYTPEYEKPNFESKHPPRTHKQEKPNYHVSNIRPIESNYGTSPPENPTYSHTPGNGHKTPSATGPQYTGGFGGPPGILKPIESETSPENPIATYTPEYEKPNLGNKHPPRANTQEQEKPNHISNARPIESNYGTSPPENPTYSHIPENVHKTPSATGPQYTGGFGGPPGVLKPIGSDSSPKHEKPNHVGNTRPVESHHGNTSPEIPTYSHTPENEYETPSEPGSQYTVDFDGAPGILKPDGNIKTPEKHRPTIASEFTRKPCTYGCTDISSNLPQSGSVSSETFQTENDNYQSSEQQIIIQNKPSFLQKCKGNCGDTNLKPKQPNLTLEAPTEDGIYEISKVTSSQKGNLDDNKCVGNNCKGPARQPQPTNRPYQNPAVGSPDSENDGEYYIPFQPGPVPTGNLHIDKPSTNQPINTYPSDVSLLNQVNCKSGNCAETSEEDIQLDQRFATSQSYPEEPKPISHHSEAPAKPVGCNGVCKRRLRPPVPVSDIESTAESVYSSNGIKYNGCKSGCGSKNNVPSLPITSFVAAGGGIYTPTLVISSRPGCAGGCNGKNQLSHYDHGFAGSSGLAFSSAGAASQGGSFVPVFTGNDYYNDGNNNAGNFFNKLFSGVSGATSAASSGSYAYSGSSAGSASVSSAFSGASAGAGYGSRHYRSSRYN